MFKLNKWYYRLNVYNEIRYYLLVYENNKNYIFLVQILT